MRRTRAACHYVIRCIKKMKNRSYVIVLLMHFSIILGVIFFWSKLIKFGKRKQPTVKLLMTVLVRHPLLRGLLRGMRICIAVCDHSVLHDISDEVENGINSDIMYSDCVISCSDVYNAISKLAPHKNDGKYELLSDHFIQAGADLSVHIGFLLSATISHGTVPTDFSVNTILPIPKVKNAGVSSSDNFRGIALSSIFVKLYDHIVINRFHDKVCTSELQFGFKNNSSTHMCTMVLKETLSYCTHHNSFIYCTFLDATKAFDGANFCKLFRILIDRSLPVYIVRMLINMYILQVGRISWAGILSNKFPVPNGVREGGVLSPLLFCVYIDDLLVRLSQSGVGCYLGNNFVGALAYADDVVLVCPTPSAMRRLLSLCEYFALEYDVKFNAKKSKLLVCPPRKRNKISNQLTKRDCMLFIDGKLIEQVKSLSHLGYIIMTDLNDSDDILYRCNCFVGQANNMMCGQEQVV